jgi:predicted amidophosphoribosyltransferase
MSCHLSMNLMELVVFEIYALTTQLDFCYNCQKKLKLPLDFCHNCQKNENSLGRKCSTSVTTLTSEKLISTPDREKMQFL